VSESPYPPHEPVDIDLDRVDADRPAAQDDLPPAPDAAATSREHWLAPLVGPEALALISLVLAAVGVFAMNSVAFVAITVQGRPGADGQAVQAPPPVGLVGVVVGLVSVVLSVLSLRRRPRGREVSVWARALAATGLVLGLLVTAAYALMWRG
jgi:hypothetical protein